MLIPLRLVNLNARDGQFVIFGLGVKKATMMGTMIYVVFMTALHLGMVKTIHVITHHITVTEDQEIVIQVKTKIKCIGPSFDYIPKFVTHNPNTWVQQVLILHEF